MAAFSYQEVPYVLSPEMMMKLSSSSSSTTTTTNNNSPLLSPSCCFSDDQSHLLNSSYPEPIFEQLQFQYPFEDIVNLQQEQLKPIDFSLHENSCAEEGTPMGSSENEPYVTAKQSNQMNPVSNKRKPKGNGSKDVRAKKQKKGNNEGMMKEEEDKEEEDDEKDKEKKKSSNPGKEAPKGYIHVRARRGQATDSHSLAERVRREKISERMKFLQSLVPGCDKVTGKATMLDEIINYVQSLQTQVEFLSMKLASLSPMVYSFGVDLDHLLLEQQGLNSMTQQCSPSTTQTPPYAPVATVETTGIAGPLVGPPTVFQQQVQRGANPPCLEDNVIGSLYWGTGEQGGSDLINQPGFYNNNNLMYSF